MKQTLIFILLVLSSIAQAASGMLDINGTQYPVDTIENYYVGPGVQYTYFTYKKGTTLHNLYQLSVDLTNPYITLEEWQAKETVGSTELMLSAHAKLNYENHRPIGSTNCNFWCVQGNIDADPDHYTGLYGVPFAGTARNGVMIGEPSNWNSGHGDRGYVMLNDSNRVVIRNMKFAGLVSTDTSSYRIKDVNRRRTNFTKNEICLFNRYIGTNSTRSLSGGKVEVLFTLVDTAWAINQSVKARVTNINQVGGTSLKGLEGALQCNGTGATWAQQNLKVGDEFTIMLGAYATSSDSIRPIIQQMATGNALIMENGVINQRNTNEDYNNRNYARTVLATNNTGDHFWMLVSQTPGNYTAEMCGILKNNGATWAAGMDGGGSAQMNVLGKIVNKTTESTARAVANCMFVVSKSPDDNNIGIMRYMDASRVDLASYASYSPVLYAYNQYGMLIEKDFQGYTLQVEPSTLGTISKDGKTFIAGAQGGDGYLIATAGNATAQQPIHIEPATLMFRYDSVVVDKEGYKIEIFAQTAKELQPVDSKQFSWVVENEQICSVSAEGILFGIENGNSYVYGSVGDFSDTLLAKVQIADAHLVELGGAIDTTLQRAGRTTKLEIPIKQKFFGRPDSILIPINSQAAIQTVVVNMKGNNSKEEKISFTTSYTPSTNYSYIITPNKVGEENDEGKFPLYMDVITFTFKDMVSGQNYKFKFDGIILCYATWKEVEEGILSTPYSDQIQTQKIMVDGVTYILHKGSIYDMQGQIIR